MAENNFQDDPKALDELFARSSSYRVGDNYIGLLRFINKFPRISPFNAFLLYTQYPGTQFVASAAKWREHFGRSPKRDARPLVILIPFGPVSFVYDVSETEGGSPFPEELLRPFKTDGRIPKNAYDLTVGNLGRDSILFYESDFGSARAGYARRDGVFSVSINKNLKLEDKYSTLAHELGHVYSGHLGSIKTQWWPDRHTLPKDIVEIEAESISFLVCKRLGLQTSSEKYLADYVQSHREFPPFSLDSVLTVSGYIEKMGRKHLPPRKSNETKKR